MSSVERNSFEERLGIWAEDPRSLASARVMDVASRERQTDLGRLDSLVGRVDQSKRKAVAEMKAGAEYPVR